MPTTTHQIESETYKTSILGFFIIHSFNLCEGFYKDEERILSEIQNLGKG